MFAAIDHKGHFRKKLTRIFKFSCFSFVNTPIFLKKKQLNFLMKNLMLNRLAPISNPKERACAPLYSETNLIKVLSSFPDHFVPVENFFKTGLKQNN